MRRFAALIIFCLIPAVPINLLAEPNTGLLKELLMENEKAVSTADNYYKYIEALKSLGFYKYDYKDSSINARNAVIRFQSDCNLVVDGIQGSQFNRAITKRLLVSDGFKHTDVVVRPPSKGNWIIINRTKRILTLYHYKTVVKKYPVAIGKDSTATPEGKFKVKLKAVNPMWSGGGYAKPVKGGSPKNPLGYRWIGLSLRKGYVYGIHGNNNPYSIGREVSKGCIRMINSDVSQLFNIVKTGTPVWVGDEETLNRWGVMQKSFY
ncbi:MAG: L,D-transpeptidase family protein [Caulobacteraceae bacterium]